MTTFERAGASGIEEIHSATDYVIPDSVRGMRFAPAWRTLSQHPAVLNNPSGVAVAFFIGADFADVTFVHGSVSFAGFSYCSTVPILLEGLADDGTVVASAVGAANIGTGFNVWDPIHVETSGAATIATIRIHGANAGTAIDDFAVAWAMDVLIDIKPGSFPNAINLGSKGNVPVAILSTEDFDATQVDPLTVTLAGAAVRLKRNGQPQAAFEDVDKNGRLDLVVHIETQALELGSEDTVAALDGTTFGGTRIRGVDSVQIVP